MQEFDAIVVGASIAGSSTALLLGRAGHRVLLVDRAVFPRSKVCGEGLMPAGVQILRCLGVDLVSLGACPFPGVRFRARGQPPLELNFSELSPEYYGLAVSRERLDERLAREAARLPTVEFRQGVPVEALRRLPDGMEVIGGGIPCRSRVLVGADGIRSRFHTWAGIERLSSSSGRFALRALFTDYSHSTDWVDVHCGSHGEAYVAPLGHRAARVTLLLNGPPGPSNNLSPATRFSYNIARFPEIVRRISGPAQNIDATAPVSRTVSRCHGDRLLLVGDAAGAVDPITGQGMTLALRDAVLAAEVLDSALRADRLAESHLHRYTRLRSEYFSRADELSRRVLRMVKHPWLIRRARRIVAGNQELRSRLLASAVNPGRSSGLRWSDRLRLVAGF